MADAISNDTLVPLKIASAPTGIPRATLYRWAASGRIPVYLVDGERCGRLGDILEADETRRTAHQHRTQ